MQPTTSPTPSAMPTNPNTEGPKTKKSNGLIIATVFCAILAVAGIAFGIYSFLQLNDKTAENDKLKAQIESAGIEPGISDASDNKASGQTISNAVAQNIIEPYIRDFYYVNNVFDHEFSEDAKVEIAYLNVWPTFVTSSPESDDKIINYYSFNETYQELFGSNAELAKKNYKKDYTADFKYDDSLQSFIVNQGGSGGTGELMFSIVKSARIDGENLLIEVYHDKILLCDAEPNDGYCFNPDDTPIRADNAIFQNFTDKIPVYKMTFVEDSGHFVLKDIQKQ
ncbi:hypothetical protein IKF92_01710 [Candidatus Saccharibacteria bacterium]|nr:hypothetical protein [Candidatus Saccharibacteria bacterium]